MGSIGLRWSVIHYLSASAVQFGVQSGNAVFSEMSGGVTEVRNVYKVTFQYRYD